MESSTKFQEQEPVLASEGFHQEPYWCNYAHNMWRDKGNGCLVDAGEDSIYGPRELAETMETAAVRESMKAQANAWKKGSDGQGWR